MLQELMEKVSNAHEVGMSNRNDLLKAQVELNKAKLDLQKAQNGLELSRMNLCRITGLPFNSKIAAVDTSVSIIRPAVSEAENEILTGRPEYQLLMKNIDMQEQQIRMARAGFLPVAGIQAGYNHIGGIEFSGTEFSIPAECYGISKNSDFPLGGRDGKNQCCKNR